MCDIPLDDTVSSNKEMSSFFTESLTYQQASETDTSTINSSADNVHHRPHAQLDTFRGKSSSGEEVSLKLSRINGAINKMTKEQLQEKLKEIRLNTSGVKNVLKKRLKHYYKRQRMIQLSRSLTEDERMKYDYLVVIDFEATCSETNENFVHEIIEFPAVLIDTRNLTVCHVFHCFCKPKVNPILTEFCTMLTGISQSQVDEARDFTDVFRDFEEWLCLHKLGTEHKFAVLTDGPWDMARFLKTQIELSGLSFPRWGKQWINLRKAYIAFYECKRASLHQMLEDLGMTFQGRPHCGLDDAHNIAAITLRLLQDGCVMRINEHYCENNISSQKRNGMSRSSRHSKSHQASRIQVTKTTDCNSHHGAEVLTDVTQEGENLEDLFAYLKLQKS